jgi:hypothetical protein
MPAKAGTRLSRSRKWASYTFPDPYSKPRQRAFGRQDVGKSGEHITDSCCRTCYQPSVSKERRGAATGFTRRGGSRLVSQKVPLIEREFRRFCHCTRPAFQIAWPGRFPGRSDGAWKVSRLAESASERHPLAGGRTISLTVRFWCNRRNGAVGETVAVTHCRHIPGEVLRRNTHRPRCRKGQIHILTEELLGFRRQ